MLSPRLLAIFATLAMAAVSLPVRAAEPCEIPPVPEELERGVMREPSGPMAEVVEQYRRKLEAVMVRCGGAEAARQAKALLESVTKPPDIEIQAYGSARGWTFAHRDFRNTRSTAYLINQPREGREAPVGGPPFGALVVPLGARVMMQVLSNDSIHTFKVPGLGISKDAVPGRIGVVGIPTDWAGVYPSDCGTGCDGPENGMSVTVHVVEQEIYRRWYEALDAATSPLPRP